MITGCSTGFGRALAEEVLKTGNQVVLGVRNLADVEDLQQLFPKLALSVQLDMTKGETLVTSVQSAIAHFGQIDVLVNNAGIGYFSSIEESDEVEVRRMFEINFFGLANLTQLVLPYMRKQKSGHILNIASIGGLMAFPAVGFYNATKFALDGYSEALSKELAPLGIKVTIICPSGFRTDWAGRSASVTPTEIADYEATAGANISNLKGYSGTQPGDPKRAALAMIQIVETEHPPLRLLLGSAALRNGRLKLEQLQKDFDNWAEVTEGADFPS